MSSELPVVAVRQPTLVREPFHRQGWVYEEKYDGWRMVAYKHGPQVCLVSRNGRDHSERFADLAAAIAVLPAHTLILDGEVCVFDADLVSQFHLLGEPHPDVMATPPIYMAFDLLYQRAWTCAPGHWAIGAGGWSRQSTAARTSCRRAGCPTRASSPGTLSSNAGTMMNRRTFLWGLTVGALGAPITAEAHILSSDAVLADAVGLAPAED